MRRVTESNQRQMDERTKRRAERGLGRRLWDNNASLVAFAAYIGAVIVIYQQWLPEWVGFVVFMLPTVGFVGCVIMGLLDPYWFVSVRNSSGGLKITLNGKGRA